MHKQKISTVLAALLTLAPLQAGAQRVEDAARPPGLILDGSAAQMARLQAIYDAAPAGGTIYIAGGKWPANALGWALPIEKKVSGKRVLWDFLGPVDAGLGMAPGTNPVRSVGDGDMTESFAGGILTFARTLQTGKDESNPGIQIDMENRNSNFVPAFYGFGPDIAALQINASSFAGSTGQMNGMWINLNSGGNNAYVSQDQGMNVVVHKSGQNSTWQISGMTYDETGLPPNAFASIAQELDIDANGPDDPDSLYNGHKGNRVFAYYSARPYNFPAYEPGKTYPVGAKVWAIAAGGVKSVYIASTGGQTGAAAPAWPWAEQKILPFTTPRQLASSSSF